MYEVRECLQSLVDRVVTMTEDDPVQSVDISLSTDGLPELVDENDAPIDTARDLINRTLNLTIA